MRPGGRNHRERIGLSFGLSAVLLGACANKDAEHPAPNGSASAALSATASAAASAGHGQGGAAAKASASASAASSATAHSATESWTYGGAKGPMFWGDLQADWKLCKEGKKQSPIDIPSKTEDGKKDAPRLAVDYLPIPLRIVNNGHSVQVDNVANNYLMVGKKRYELIQFHFHSPSEHTIAGKRFDLEMHLMHKAADKSLAVLSILFTSGEANEALKLVWKKLPKNVSLEPAIVKGKTVDIGSLVSLRQGYFQYSGSLTTPPCKEDVSWFLLKQTHQLSAKQVRQFRDLMQGRNNRMVQPLEGRAILSFKP